MNIKKVQHMVDIWRSELNMIEFAIERIRKYLWNNSNFSNKDYYKPDKVTIERFYKKYEISVCTLTQKLLYN